MEKYRVTIDQLKNRCEDEKLEFETTKEVRPLRGIIGQKRGVEALSFGLTMNQKGYNIYVSGRSGTGRSTFTYSIAEEFANKKSTPLDWVYVYNFQKKENPKALSFKPGEGKKFKKELESAIESLKTTIPETFSGMEYETRKSDLYKITNQKRNQILKELNEKSEKYGFLYTPTDRGLVSLPLKGKRPMSEEEYQGLSLEEREKLMNKYNDLHVATIEDFNKLRLLDENLREGMVELDKKIMNDIVKFYTEKLIEKFGKEEKVRQYICDIENDIIENIDKFKLEDEKEELSIFDLGIDKDEDFFTRYKVNLFIDNSELKHAPIISETNPIFNNLIGTIEYKSKLGVLATDFTQIKPGSLHLANGGYLIFQIREILNNPVSWEILKRALNTEEINIENLSRLLGYAVTSSIKPEPIPLDIKVILIGDPYIYNLLYAYDDDFKKLFKIMSDFDMDMKRDDKNINLMVEFIANHCKANELKDFHKRAVARVIEYSSRLSDHKEKMTTQFNQIVEILVEADLWAKLEESDIVYEKHVDKAINKKIYRSNKYEEKLNELFLEKSILIDLEGEAVGQINGLAVMGTGEYSFGKPSRITASVYRGEDGIINIEREANQSGSIHDKGVLILSGYLGEKYAKKKPLNLTIGIGFEQNYSIVDGDSASSTELYAILSSLANIPIKQYIAVTGSVNQKGEIQPIGGVNEKIEGFFSVCKLTGLTGKQGVLIPRQNLKNLMLRDEVIEGVKNNKFHIYAIEKIEEGMEILTGFKMGELNENGDYPENTINNIILEKLAKIKDEKNK